MHGSSCISSTKEVQPIRPVTELDTKLTKPTLERCKRFQHNADVRAAVACPPRGREQVATCSSILIVQ